MKTIKPEIDATLLRKYIAYAKRKVFPIMTDEARERITRFYLELRKSGEAENAPVAVTARQLEGLVRLAEACARMRLSDRVIIQDVERTINIVMTSLKQVGMDRETGKLDIDILTVGVAQVAARSHKRPEEHHRGAGPRVWPRRSAARQDTEKAGEQRPFQR